jgi:hypothetical protein
MAEGKKSFIVYTSWKIWLDGLTFEQKGQWLDWMLNYTNDNNPDYPKDKAVEIACRMAQDTLKRDLKKYNDKVERIKSARNQNPNNNNKTEIKLKSDSNQSEISSVNVNVNDNVNVNEVSKDTNNNILSISKDISNITSETRELSLELPTISGNKGNSYPIYQDQIDHWQSIYLGVDVYAELNKMLAWLEANPKNKKTYQGTPKFIVNWLSRQQDRASRNGTPVLTRSSVDDNGGFEEL